ncbi:MAG TPA: glutathione S-transferase family protein [Caulobacteraceae bacterium]|nr:glutathione S-transferase family protein [Caulobacteraceae bacterium]
MSITVHTWEPNANSGKPLLLLKEKGAEFDYRYINMGALEQHSPEYLKVNPNGTVPTVIVGGFSMFESTPAMEYLDEVVPGPHLTPKDPYRRWKMRWWMRFIDEYLMPSLAMQAGSAAGGRMQMSEEEKDAAVARIPLPERARVWRLILDRGVSDEELTESRRRVTSAIATFEKALGESDYLAGDEFTLADLDAMTTLHSWPLMREDVSEDATPNLWAWFRRCHARQGLKDAYALGRFIGTRMPEVREKLGLDA